MFHLKLTRYKNILHITRIHVGFRVMWSFYIPHVYVILYGMVYKQIVWIPIGTNCAPLIADLFLYCNERDFMSNLQKVKRFDLIDKFNDTSRYIDYIFTFDNPECAEHIPDIYPRELSWIKQKLRTKNKENSSFDLNLKDVGSYINNTFTTNAMTLDFLCKFPWVEWWCCS